MKTTQALTDKFAIGLSMLCTIHCLVLPLLLVTLPSLGSLQLQNEAFHTWTLLAVIPTSIYALTIGCKKHQRYRLLLWGVSGLTLMISAVFLSHEITGESDEKILTLLGAIIVVAAHWGNFRRCRQYKNCSS
jgi:hypothetical protein